MAEKFLKNKREKLKGGIPDVLAPGTLIPITPN
jgi:hypothetical protein